MLGMHRISILRRHLCVAAALAPLRDIDAAVTPDGELGVQRLSWAGIRIDCADTTMLLDPLTDPLLTGGHPVAIDVRSRWRYAMVTNLLNDHYHPPTLRAALGDRGRVVCLAEHAATVASDGLRVRAVRLWEPLVLGGGSGTFAVTTVPCADGFGETGTMWVLRTPRRRVLHGGDVQWHAHWWRIGAQLGPFDAAFLPINGAVVRGQPPHVDEPRTLTPEQAVSACVVLGAKRLCPIHHGRDDPPGYVETPNALDRARQAARRHGVVLTELQEGDWLKWDEPP